MLKICVKVVICGLDEIKLRTNASIQMRLYMQGGDAIVAIMRFTIV